MSAICQWIFNQEQDLIWFHFSCYGADEMWGERIQVQAFISKQSKRRQGQTTANGYGMGKTQE